MITLENIGKRYNRDWIFRGVNLSFQKGEKWVFQGGNGSGKSTLLQVAGSLFTPSEGQVSYRVDGLEVSPENIYQHLTMATPYMELYEELSLAESIDFHFRMKPLIGSIKVTEVADMLYLREALSKPVKTFSSGMKQRLKLGLAILTDSPILLLDEPTSNLDRQAIDWYKELCTTYLDERLVLVCSNNQEEEFFFCDHSVKIEDYK